ncbi:hypothetical protein ACFV3E_28445 [Streptomyces sp. NPDC059718]
MSGTPVARLVPISGSQSVLDRMVAEGRATPPAASGPVPVPPVLGDPGIDTAAVLVSLRDEERW